MIHALTQARETYKVALRQLPIEDVARKLGLEPHGRRARCLRPDAHKNGDRSPSMSFDPGRNIFRCWVCTGVGGDTISLAMLALNSDFKTACGWLSENFGVSRLKLGLAGSSVAASPPRSPAPRPNPEPGIEEPSAEVCAVYEDVIARSRITPAAWRYCKRRGWPYTILEKLGIKAIANPDRMFRTLVEAHGLDLLLRAGIAAHPKDERTGDPDVSRPPYFRFWKWPLLFPFRSRKTGRIVYLQARHFGTKPTTGRDDRWQNVGGRISVLWNDPALGQLKPRDRVYLTEGIPDGLTLVAQGLPAVSFLGVGNLRDALIRELAPFDVVIAAQTDKASQKLIIDLGPRFAALGVRGIVKRLPSGTKDVNVFFTEPTRNGQ